MSTVLSTNTTPSAFITLISRDGFEFHIRRSAACKSGTLRRMLDVDSNFTESQSGVCRLENIDALVLGKVVEYFYYAEKYRDVVGAGDGDGKNGNGVSGGFDVPSEMCLELLMAADYLET